MSRTPENTNYQFNPVIACSMCGAAPERFGVLGVRLNVSQGRNPRHARGAGVTIVRCRDCGLIFPDPQPVPDSVFKHYDMSGDEYWTDERANAPEVPVLGDRFSALRRRFPDQHAPAALDIGVGSGFSARALIGAGFDFYGCEPIPQFRELALRLLALPGNRIRLAGVESVDYPDGSFDLINFGAVLEHLYDPGTALASAVRWLRPGGLIVLEVPSADWLVARLINAFFRLKGTNYVTHTSPMHAPFHLFEFTPASFAAHGRRNGYVVDTVKREVGVDPHLASALQRLLYPVMARTGTGLTLNLVLRKP